MVRPETERVVYSGAQVFDGRHSRPATLVVEGAEIVAVLPAAEVPKADRHVTLQGGILAPGFVDLQVNGGDGINLNDAPEVASLKRISDAHASLGTMALLPTLITDTPEQTRAAVDSAKAAIAAGVPGIVGLHLEGPHLSLARKGAHDPALIRPMSAEDLAFLASAARDLPALMLTVAAETVTPEQISVLTRAGACVSLGHSDASFEVCRAAFAAGARVATHLFNAMSQLGNRDPGLVGAVIALGGVDAGVIADGVHVHPESLGVALRAKTGPGRVFLVTDAMATAGSAIAGFTLNGREVRRDRGRLTLADGTLAGADVDMARSLRFLVNDVGVLRDVALEMATGVPARVIGLSKRYGSLAPGAAADFVHLGDDLELRRIWRGGVEIERFSAQVLHG